MSAHVVARKIVGQFLSRRRTGTMVTKINEVLDVKSSGGIFDTYYGCRT